MFTIQQLIDQHKVVLDVLLADLAEIGSHDVAHLVEELKHHGGVDILFGDRCQPDVGALDVEEAGAGYVGDRGAHLLPSVDHVHSERVHCITPVGGVCRKRCELDKVYKKLNEQRGWIGARDNKGKDH